mgnify:CR=1 FL=1
MFLERVGAVMIAVALLPPGVAYADCTRRALLQSRSIVRPTKFAGVSNSRTSTRRYHVLDLSWNPPR